MSRPAPRFHTIAGDDHRMVQVTDGAKGPVASVVSKTLAAKSFPPVVEPISGDPDHVIRCDWDPASNEYVCDTISATDPRASV